MLPTYLLARDHLQQAAAILQGADSRSLQLRSIIERTVNLMDDFQPEAVNMLNDFQPQTEQSSSNILDFAKFKARSAARH